MSSKLTTLSLIHTTEMSNVPTGLFTWILLVLLFFSFIKGGFHSLYSFILMILSLSYLLWSTNLSIYGTLVLLLSVVLFMMFFLIMSINHSGMKIGFSGLSGCLLLFLFLFLFLFLAVDVRLLGLSDGWITMVSYSTSFWMGHLLLIGILSWLMVSVSFIWIRVAPQTIHYTWTVLGFINGSAVGSIILDWSFLLILGTILFAVPGALKNIIARSSDTSSSSYLLTGYKWREEWERWSADIYECGITADTISFAYQPSFLRVLVIGGAFLFLDIEWIFIAVYYLLSPSVNTISLITIILLGTQALMKVFYILHLMKPQPNRS